MLLRPVLMPILRNPLQGIADGIRNMLAELLGSSQFFAPLTHSLVLARGTGSPTFTRATPATVTDHEGVLRTAIAGEARFEGARRVRNLLTFTEDFSNAVWDKYQCTAPVNAVVGPDGRVTNTLTADANGGQHAVRQSATVVSGSTIIWSVYVKAGTASWVRLQCVSMANANCFFNISSGAVGTAAGCTGTIEAAGGGWYRCSIKGTTSATSGFNQVELADGDNDVNSVVSSGLTAYIWGAQLEDITGRADQTTPSEYVSVGVPSDWAGTDLVTNGTFTTDTTGWTALSGAALSVVSGRLRITNGAVAYGGAQQAITTVVGQKYVFSRDVTAGTIATGIVQIGTSSGTADLYAGGFSGAPLSVEFTATTTTTFIQTYVGDTTNGGYADFDNISVKPAYYHGSFVDGVKCFPTDINGSPIPSSTLLGYQAEGARTNLCLRSEDFTTGWTYASGGTGSAPVVTANQAIAPNGTLTADKIVMTLNGGTTLGDTSTIYQAPATGAGTYTGSLWLKGEVGGEVVLLRHVAGGAYAQLTLTTEWQRFSVTEVRAADNFELVLRGSLGSSNAVTIYAWGAQLELGAFASSYIATTTAAVTRNADVLTYSLSGNMLDTKGWCYAEVTAQGLTPGFNNIIVGDANAGSYPLYLKEATSKGAIYDGATELSFGDAFSVPITTPMKVASTYGGASMSGSVSGSAVGSGAFDGVMNITNIGIGHYGGAGQIFGTIRNVRIGQRQLSASEMQAITA